MLRALNNHGPYDRLFPHGTANPNVILLLNGIVVMTGEMIDKVYRAQVWIVFVPGSQLGLEANQNQGITIPEKKNKKHCRDVAKLDGPETEKGALARLIFAEATGFEKMVRNYLTEEDSGILGLATEGLNGYFKERYAIAATVYNQVERLSHITTKRDPLRLGSPVLDAYTTDLGNRVGCINRRSHEESLFLG